MTREPDDLERNLTTKEIAAAFGLQRRSGQNWADAGCPHDDLGMGRGRGKRFNLLEVRRWIDETGRKLSAGNDALVPADFMDTTPKKAPKPKKRQKKRKSRAKKLPAPKDADTAAEMCETTSQALEMLPAGSGEASGVIEPADAGAHEDDDDVFDFLQHKVDLSLAKLRKELAMAQRYELDVEQKRGNLISKEEVERTRLERVAYARARMIGGPSILAPDLAHASLEVVEEALNKWIAQILADLAGELLDD